MNAVLTRLLRWVGMLLYWMGLHPIVIWLNRRQPTVLLYHACDEAESDFIRGLNSNTPPRQFAAHLDFLRHHYRVIPLTDFERGVIPDRAVVITFDDGYRSTYERAFPLLRARGLPATMYLVTDVVDNRALVWVNELNWLLRNRASVARPLAGRALGVAPDATPEIILDRARTSLDADRIHALVAEIRAAAEVDGPRLAREAALYLCWEEVAEMRRHGISFGNHTATHPSLVRLSEAAQRREIGAARDVVRARLGECHSFAYPFGDHDATSRRVAVELGTVSIMELVGANRPLDLHGVARIPIGAAGRAAFFAEVEVVARVKGTLKRWRER